MKEWEKVMAALLFLDCILKALGDENFDIFVRVVKSDLQKVDANDFIGGSFIDCPPHVVVGRMWKEFQDSALGSNIGHDLVR